MKIIVLLLVSGVLGLAQPAPVDLTVGEVVSIYAVPYKERPAYKVEWKVSEKCRFRLEWQYRDSAVSPWQVLQSSERVADRSVFVMFQWSFSPQIRADDGRLVVPVRFGFVSATSEGWSSFDAGLEKIGPSPTWSRGSEDRSVLMSVQDGSREYRLYLQKVI